jgi:hypothetical protein
MTQYENMLAKMSREALESEFWAIYKDAYGVRPRHVNIAELDRHELISAIMGAYNAI